MASIKVKLHFIGIKKGLYNSIDRLSGVIIAPVNTILKNPEEIMFKRVGETTYMEIPQYQKNFIRQWCSVNKAAGPDLTLSQVDYIIKIAEYGHLKELELAEKKEADENERSASEVKADGEVEENFSDDGDSQA